MGLAIDTATPNLDKLKRKLAQKSTINKLYARAVANLFRKHFRKSSGTNKNRFGVKNSFWDRMRNSIKENSSSSLSEVTMDRAVALRRFGGTVLPTEGRKYLTIPISRKAYGKTALEFKDESFIYPPAITFNGKTKSERSKIKKYIAIIADNGDVELLFRLIGRTNHKPNSTVTPNEFEIMAEVTNSLTKHLKE